MVVRVKSYEYGLHVGELEVDYAEASVLILIGDARTVHLQAVPEPGEEQQPDPAVVAEPTS